MTLTHIYSIKKSNGFAMISRLNDLAVLSDCVSFSFPFLFSCCFVRCVLLGPLIPFRFQRGDLHQLVHQNTA